MEAWRQVADDITRRITSGEYGPGTFLPSVRQLMAQHERSDRTVLRALQHLTEQRLVRSDSTRGYQVLGGTPAGPDLEERLSRVERRLDAAGIPDVDA